MSRDLDISLGCVLGGAIGALLGALTSPPGSETERIMWAMACACAVTFMLFSVRGK